MSGMDEGPWTSLGGLGWFLSIWVVMMAAMMFPSVAPTIALYARMTMKRSPTQGILFSGGYLTTWALVGVAAYGVSVAGGRVAHGALAWDRAGRFFAAATLAVAAIYELTPLKDVCLGKCRSPLGALLGSWRGGRRGALLMGAKNGAWCVGCCWALMASLFALGIMSIVWMAFTAALIAAEKLVPWRRPVTWATATILLAVAVLLVVAPETLPGLTIPHGHDNMTMNR
jgi:predicted metal-binding membrane protein